MATWTALRAGKQRILGGGGGDSAGPRTPTTPPRGLRPPVSCQRCLPQESIGTRRKFLSTLDPNAMLKPNPHPNAHPNPKPSPNPNSIPSPNPN